MAGCQGWEKTPEELSSQQRVAQGGVAANGGYAMVTEESVKGVVLGLRTEQVVEAAGVQDQVAEAPATGLPELVLQESQVEIGAVTNQNRFAGEVQEAVERFEKGYPLPPHRFVGQTGQILDHPGHRPSGVDQLVKGMLPLQLTSLQNHGPQGDHLVPVLGVEPGGLRVESDETHLGQRERGWGMGQSGQTLPDSGRQHLSYPQ
jgi:hypothetical protein